VINAKFVPFKAFEELEDDHPKIKISHRFSRVDIREKEVLYFIEVLKDMDISATTDVSSVDSMILFHDEHVWINVDFIVKHKAGQLPAVGVREAALQNEKALEE